MRGLLWKDFYAIRTYCVRQLGLLALAFGAVSVGTRTFSIVPPAMILAGMMLVISCISFDEAAHWDAFALTLPVNPRDIIRAKYVLFLGSIVIITLVSGLLCTGLEALLFQGNAWGVLLGAGAVCFVYIPVLCICLPLFIKLGVEKARIYMILAYLVPFLGITLLAKPFDDTLNAALASSSFTQIVLWTALALLLALTLCVVVSYRVCVKVYEAKEF